MNTIGFTINGGTELERHLFSMSEEELNIDVQYSGISSQELLDRFTEADKPDWDVLSELLRRVCLGKAVYSRLSRNDQNGISSVPRMRFCQIQSNMYLCGITHSARCGTATRRTMITDYGSR